MEYLLIDLLGTVPGHGPYELMRELETTADPELLNELTSKGLDLGPYCYDLRVVNFIARMPEMDQRMLQIRLDAVWLPSPMPTLHCQFLIPERKGAIARINEHNTRMLNGEPDLEVDDFMIIDPRVVTPNPTISRAVIITVAKDSHVPRLTEWIPDLTCAEANSLSVSANTLTIIRHAFASPNTTCQDLRFSEMEKCLAILPVEQWWDFPRDPCEIKGAWPAMLLPEMRCSATCDMRSPYQCLRMAEHNTVFCTWHKSVGVTMHVRGSKRSAKDITSKEYTNPQGLEVYEQTKRPVSGMTFASNPFASKPVGFYLPVLRYEGLYYPTETKYCGKFYFYEPESSLHLYLGNSRCFGSKVHAYVQLCHESRTPRPAQGAIFSVVTKRGEILLDPMVATGQGLLPLSQKLLLTIVQSDNLDAYDPAQCQEFQAPNNVSEAWNAFVLSRYWSVYLSQQDLPSLDNHIIPIMFPTDNPTNSSVETGEFDFLDQPICTMARDLHIDTLLFQREIGSHDCVTEILDTRLDYRSQLHDLGPIFVMQRETSKYPKIWFPHDNHLVFIGPNMQRAQMSDEIQRVFGTLYPPRGMPACTEVKDPLEDFLLLIAQDFTMDNETWMFYDVELIAMHNSTHANYKNEAGLTHKRAVMYASRIEAIKAALRPLNIARNFDIVVRYILTNEIEPDERRRSVTINGTVLTPQRIKIKTSSLFQDRFMLKCDFEVFNRQVVQFNLSNKVS